MIDDSGGSSWERVWSRFPEHVANVAKQSKQNKLFSHQNDYNDNDANYVDDDDNDDDDDDDDDDLGLYLHVAMSSFPPHIQTRKDISKFSPPHTSMPGS